MKMERNLPVEINRVEEEIDLVQLLSFLYANKYKILLGTVLAALLALLFTSLKTPIYSASVLIQLEKKPRNQLMSKVLDSLGEGEISAETEIGILRSRRVLSQTIDRLGLQLEVQEVRFPVVGPLLAALSSKPASRMSVASFSVPPAWEDLPLTLTVLSPESYQLEVENVGVMPGKVNQTLNRNGFVLNVQQIAAPAGTQFSLVSRSKFLVIESLLKRLNVAESSKGSGLLNVSLTGPDKQENISILNDISAVFIEDNRQRMAEEASKSLDFVNSLLPGIQEKLNKADIQLNDFKKQNGSVDLSLEAKAVLDSSVTLQAQLNELQLTKVELLKLYTKNHPLYRALLKKESVLNQDKAVLAKLISAMPEKQQELVSIKREIESGQEIYMQLLTKQQALGITKASTVAKIRIIDEALANPRPEGSKKLLAVILGMLVGFVLSSGICLMLYVFRKKVGSISDIESHGVNVFASVPFSKQIRQTSRHKATHQAQKKQVWLAQDYPEDLAVEALRSLRIGIFIALKQMKRNSILISGTAPEVGKTFISANLASVMVDAGKRVLLIDADMRRGYLHQLLDLSETNGLSDLLRGRKTALECIQTSAKPGLDFISRGATGYQSSELLTSKYLAELLAWAQQQYDYVIVDTPPVLAISDALVAAQHVGLSLMVVRYQITSEKELQAAINRFKKCDVKLGGAVLNGVQKSDSPAYEYAYDAESP